MRTLILGFLPVVIFWFVEEKFGTLAGLLAAVVWAVGECSWEYYFWKRIEKLTLISTGLVLFTGGLSWWLDNSVVFKFQPVIMEVLMMLALWWFGRDGVPALWKMALATQAKQKPKAGGAPKVPLLSQLPPEQQEFQKQLMRRMTLHLQWVLAVHVVVLSYYALRGTTGEWAFVKGVGFNILLFAWVGVEFLSVRQMVARRKSERDKKTE